MIRWRSAARLRHRLILQGIHAGQTSHSLLVQRHGLLALRTCGILGVKCGKAGMKGGCRVGHGVSLGGERPDAQRTVQARGGRRRGNMDNSQENKRLSR